MMSMINKALKCSVLPPLSSRSTSPSSRIYRPPLPATSEVGISSNVANVMHLFQKHQDRTLKEWWTEIPLNTDDYKELKTHYKRRGDLFEYVNYKIRYGIFFFLP